METIIIGAVVTQLIGMIFLVMRTYPSLSTKVENIINDVNSVSARVTKNNELINTHSLEIGTTKTELVNLKREFENDRETSKEIHKELRKALDENTRAIISLEITLKHLNDRLEERRP
jgi:uncharacterized membrane protein YcjF (UPF0283 family)